MQFALSPPLFSLLRRHLVAKKYCQPTFFLLSSCAVGRSPPPNFNAPRTLHTTLISYRQPGAKSPPLHLPFPNKSPAGAVLTPWLRNRILLPPSLSAPTALEFTFAKLWLPTRPNCFRFFSHVPPLSNTGGITPSPFFFPVILSSAPSAFLWTYADKLLHFPTSLPVTKLRTF